MQGKTNDNRTRILYAFFLSLVFVAIDAAVFAVLIEPLSRWLLLEPVWLRNAAHMVILSAVGTLLGCTAFFALRSQPKLIPMAYSFFPAYMLVCYAYCYFNVPAEAQGVVYRLITLYTLTPSLVGIGISWGIYACARQRRFS